MERKGMSRRGFLRTTALGTAGVILAACAPKIVTQTVVVEKPVEVVVKETVMVEGESVVVEKVVTAKPAPVELAKIVFWPEWGGKDADALQAAVNKYSESSGAEIEYLPVRDHARILASLGAGAPPDLLMTWDSGAVGTWAANGAIRELSAYIEGTGFDMDLLHPMGVAAGMMLGRQIGIPLSNYLTSVYYWHRPTFEEVGLDPDTAPETFEELVLMEKKITKVDGDGLGRLGFVPNFGQFSAGVSQTGFGGRLYSPDGRTITCDDDGMMRAAEFQGRFYKDYGVDNVGRFKEANPGDFANPAAGIQTGRIASYISGEWVPSQVDHNAPDYDYGAAYMPYPEGLPELKGTMTANSNPMIIPAAAENPDGAWALIQWLCQPDISSEMCLIVGNASPVKEGVAQMIAKVENEKYKWLLSEVWTNANVKAMTQCSPVGAQYADVLGREWDLAMALKKEPFEAMTAVKEEIQPALDKALKGMGM